MRYTKTSGSTVSLRNVQAEEGWKRAARAIGCSLIAFLFSLPSARADVVADRNKIALHTVVSSEQRPAHAALEMAVGTYVPAAPPAGITLASMRPFANAQTERHGMSAFITAYEDWKDEQKRKYRMGIFPQAQEHAIIAYVERGECAVFNGFLFGVGWHHIPSHEQYTDEDALGYGKTIDTLVGICEIIK